MRPAVPTCLGSRSARTFPPRNGRRTATSSGCMRRGRCAMRRAIRAVSTSSTCNPPSAVEMARLSPFPVLCTLHHDYVPELSDLYRRTPEVRLVAISRSQARRETAAIAAVVHHGLDPARYQPMEDQGYLLFLGRYDRVKGVAQAIEVAARAKLPLVMAGEPHERVYYESVVLLLIENDLMLQVEPYGGTLSSSLYAH